MKLAILTVSFLCALSMFSQGEDAYVVEENAKPPFKDRLFTGGNFGFNISNGLMYFEIAPILGYKVNDKLSAGVSGKYLYWGPTDKGSPFLSYKYYGGGLFSRYKLTNSIIASAEYELLNVQDLNPISGSYGERTFSNVFLLGAGYTNEIMNNVNVQLFLLYDIIDDPNSPYRYNYILGPNGIPVIYRIGFSIGF
tara:strand:- start:380 stop:964 length:585 start_codon:yes stop_codon:yes gene_type:complete